MITDLNADIIRILSKVDLELLKEQATTLENVIEHLEEDISLLSNSDDFEGEFEGAKEGMEKDRENLEGLLEFLDNLIIGLEEA